MKNSPRMMNKRGKRQELSKLSQEELVDMIEEKEFEIQDLKKMIEELEEKSGLKKKTRLKREQTLTHSYNPKWTWISKIIYVLRSVDKPLSSHQIFAFMTNMDKYLSSYSRDFNNLKVNLTKATGYKRVLAYKIKGVKQQYYCLPEWFNQQNELLPGYEVEPPLI